MALADYTVDTFKDGTINQIEKGQLPRGSAADSLNWLTEGDRIILRRGMARLGTEVDGAGRISGLKVGTRFDGVEVLFSSFNRKVKYFDTVTEDFIEVGSNILPAAANDEDISFDEYHSLAGAFVYFSSPNSSIYKIPIANPGDNKDLANTSHRGKIRIKQGRMFLWDRGDSNSGSDKTGLFGSRIDKDELSDFSETTNENVGTGDGAEKTFTATLSGITSVKTCMYVRITDATENFTDDRNGALVGSLGGTGTVNYATGAISVTFNTAPSNSQAITADYFLEDSTSEGIADFSKSTPRTAGQGFVFRQDDGGADLQAVMSLGNEEYCMHLKKTWVLTLTRDDTNADNLIYREKAGIPYWRAAIETDRGIIYITDSKDADPFVSILSPGQFSTTILPDNISTQLNLSDFRFDKAVIIEFGDFYIVGCRQKDKTFNDTTFVYSKIWKSWDRLDYLISVADIYNGALTVGDTISDNVFTLFSGLDDDGSEIPNFWTSGEIDLDVDGLKKTRKMEVEGLIGADQNIVVSISTDEGAFVSKFTIEGGGDYVDTSVSVSIGAATVGSREVGGGSGGDLSGFHFKVVFDVNTARYNKLQVKFEATKLGVASIQKFVLKDNRFKGRKTPSQYRT